MRHLFYIEQNYAFAILRPLQEAIWQLGHEIKWFLVGDELNRIYLNKNEEELSNVMEVMSWKPDVVFAPGNWIPTFFPGFKVALFHGFNVSKATRTDDKGHFNIRGCFDLYCAQGPNTTTEFIKTAAKHKNFTVRETGWPPLDTMFMKKTPVVTFRNQSRGDTSHLINVTEQAALETAIEFGLQHPPQIMQSIDNFIAETHPYSDGSSSERVINAVLSQIQSKQKLKRKPLNLIRNFKSLLKLI